MVDQGWLRRDVGAGGRQLAERFSVSAWVKVKDAKNYTILAQQGVGNAVQLKQLARHHRHGHEHHGQRRPGRGRVALGWSITLRGALNCRFPGPGSTTRSPRRNGSTSTARSAGGDSRQDRVAKLRPVHRRQGGRPGPGGLRPARSTRSRSGTGRCPTEIAGLANTAVLRANYQLDGTTTDSVSERHGDAVEERQ